MIWLISRVRHCLTFTLRSPVDKRGFFYSINNFVKLYLYYLEHLRYICIPHANVICMGFTLILDYSYNCILGIFCFHILNYICRFSFSFPINKMERMFYDLEQAPVNTETMKKYYYDCACTRILRCIKKKENFPDSMAYEA